MALIGALALLAGCSSSGSAAATDASSNGDDGSTTDGSTTDDGSTDAEASSGCATAADCPVPASDCDQATCVQGVCGVAHASAGTSCSSGGTVCDGQGSCVECNAASDCPASATKCETVTCDAGTCATSHAPSTTACSDDGGTTCNGAGKCVACNVASDCPATGTVCKTAACASNQCATTNAATGTPCTDHGGVVCDGSGSCVATHCMDAVADADETDVDCGGSCGACADGKKCKLASDCTSVVCTGGTCQIPTCSDGVRNGNETDKDCGGAGYGAAHACPRCADALHCLASADCASSVCVGDVCQAPSCTDGVKNGAETDKDCGGATCDASGHTCALGLGCAIVGDCTGAGGSCSSTTYVPGVVCAASVCANGANVDCAASGKVCNAGAGCVACNAPSDCPAQTNECIVNTCVANVCGTAFLDQTHTLTTGQIAGDCQRLVCNGAGGTTSVGDASDAPVATSSCESNPSCSGTPLAPTFTYATAGTPCATSMGSPGVCGDATAPGQCVQCNTDSDCYASFEAGVFSCVNHMCQ